MVEGPKGLGNAGVDCCCSAQSRWGVNWYNMKRSLALRNKKKKRKKKRNNKGNKRNKRNERNKTNKKNEGNKRNEGD